MAVHLAGVRLRLACADQTGARIRRPRCARTLAHLWCAAAAILCAALPAATQPAPDFYAGKQISLIVGSGVGGGYDLQARLAARHLGRHIPGNPSFVVQNMPAAGSIAA